MLPVAGAGVAVVGNAVEVVLVVAGNVVEKLT
jgi:hypothetical protein